jgi:hypothetical protein
MACRGRKTSLSPFLLPGMSHYLVSEKCSGT